MKSKDAWQVLSAVGLCILNSGCGGSCAETKPPPKPACADYGALTAALAQATVDCTGTIGPDSFEVKDGFLQNKFQACTIPPPYKCGPDTGRDCPLDEVKRIVDLQRFRTALPQFQQCLTDRHRRWSDLFKRAQIEKCPSWKTPVAVGVGSKNSRLQRGRMRLKLSYAAVPNAAGRKSPVVFYGEVPKSAVPAEAKRTEDQQYVDLRVPTKSSVSYTIFFPDGSFPNEEAAQKNCLDPAICAAQCAAFLPGFVVSAGGDQLIADPASWYRDDVFGMDCGNSSTDNPYCPPDFVHPMSVNSTSDGLTVPPGDLYGNRRRANEGEHCLRYAPGPAGQPGFDYETDLVLECTTPSQTTCLSRCGN